MTPEAFYPQLEELLELDAGAISGQSALRDLEGWNSMAVISLIAMIDEQYGVALPPKGIAECVTAGDLFKLIQDHLAKVPTR